MCCTPLLGFPYVGTWLSEWINRTVMLNHAPLHGSAAPNSAALPYSISVSTSSFSPGDSVTVTLQANSGTSFKGFLLQALTVAGNAIVGTFTITDSTTQGISCNDFARSAVSHKSSTQKSKITTVWVAPSGVGNIRFRATFLQNYNTFWSRVESQIILSSVPVISTSPALGTKSSETTATTTKIQEEILSVPVISKSPSLGTKSSENTTTNTTSQGEILFQIYSDTCGKMKTCFCNPEGCSTSTSGTCMFASISPASKGGFTFEMSASPGPGYVAVGFSGDKLMGNDDIYGCVLNAAGEIEVQHVQSIGRSISSIQPLGNSVENIITSYINGAIKCSFTTINNISSQVRAATSQDYYLFLAYGPSQNGNIQIHSKTPAISNQKVNILSSSIVSTSAPSRLIYVHGALMLFAWMTTGSVGMICARYLKTAAKKQFLGKNLWFQIHVFMMVLTVITCIIAFILAFVSQMGWSGGTHPILGCIVMILSFFQPILAIFRPPPNAKRRPLFYWGHTMNALVIKVLAVAAMFLGLQLMDTSSSQWLDKVMGGFLGWEALIFIILEINARTKSKDTSEEPNTQVNTEVVFFSIYVSGNMAFLTALLVGIGASEFHSI